MFTAAEVMVVMMPPPLGEARPRFAEVDESGK